jgi:hypothetical protein
MYTPRSETQTTPPRKVADLLMASAMTFGRSRGPPVQEKEEGRNKDEDQGKETRIRTKARKGKDRDKDEDRGKDGKQDQDQDKRKQPGTMKRLRDRGGREEQARSIPPGWVRTQPHDQSRQGGR